MDLAVTEAEEVSVPEASTSESAAHAANRYPSGRYPAGRKVFSCNPCRTRKIKCDRAYFCANCTRRGVLCEWSPGMRPPPSASPSPPVVRPPISSTSSTIPLPFPPSQTTMQSPVSTASATSPNNFEAFDHSILLEQDSSSAGAVRKGKRPATTFNKFPFGSEGLETFETLLGAVPERAYCDALITVYLDRVEWIHKPLHVPSFLSEYNKFWEMDPQLRSTSIPPKWLALLYIVLCLGLHFGDSVGQEAEQELLFMCCQQALSCANFLAAPSLEAIQTIIGLCLYLNNSNRSQMAQMLLGMAIKMALIMGLSRIPNEDMAENSDVLEREMGRRLWWSLTCQDSYTASNCHCTYTIQTSQISTSLFANVDDSNLGPGLPYVNKPLLEPTESSFHLAKIPFALTTRKYIDAINESYPTPAYSRILELDQEYRTIYDQLPTFLRPDLPQPLTSAHRLQHLSWQRTFTGITLHNRIMRLHRAYMARGYTDPQYEYSTNACLVAAKELLSLVANGRVAGFPGTRWWVNLVHIWTAGLVGVVDLVQCDGVMPEEVAEKRAMVESAVEILSAASSSSPVAERGCSVLRGLLEQDVARRANEESRKRAASEEIPQPVAKRQELAGSSAADGIQRYEPIPEDTFALLDGFDPFSGWDSFAPELLPTSEYWNSLLAGSLILDGFPDLSRDLESIGM